MSKELVALVGSAKSRMDAGFSEIGRALKPEDAVGRAMTTLAARAVAKANALALLAVHNHANEALPLLRSLLETAVQMRWIADADSERRAVTVLEERRLADWDMLWPRGRAKKRAQELGFWDQRFERVLTSCREHLRANAAGLPWAHLYAGEDDGGVSAAEVLRAAAAIMAHVVKALDLRWPGKFPGADEIAKKAME